MGTMKISAGHGYKKTGSPAEKRRHEVLKIVNRIGAEIFPARITAGQRKRNHRAGSSL